MLPLHASCHDTPPTKLETLSHLADSIGVAGRLIERLSMRSSERPAVACQRSLTPLECMHSLTSRCGQKSGLRCSLISKRNKLLQTNEIFDSMSALGDFPRCRRSATRLCAHQTVAYRPQIQKSVHLATDIPFFIAQMSAASDTLCPNIVTTHLAPLCNICSHPTNKRIEP